MRQSYAVAPIGGEEFGRGRLLVGVRRTSRTVSPRLVPGPRELSAGLELQVSVVCSGWIAPQSQDRVSPVFWAREIPGRGQPIRDRRPIAAYIALRCGSSASRTLPSSGWRRPLRTPERTVMTTSSSPSRSTFSSTGSSVGTRRGGRRPPDTSPRTERPDPRTQGGCAQGRTRTVRPSNETRSPSCSWRPRRRSSSPLTFT